MAKFRFSRRAKADLLNIGEYTLRKWGETQATRYLGELEDCCQTLGISFTCLACFVDHGA